MTVFKLTHKLTHLAAFLQQNNVINLSLNRSVPGIRKNRFVIQTSRGGFMLAKAFTSVVIGIDAHPVEVEVDIANGLPTFSIVGLPEAAVKESKERVKAAIKNSGYGFPDDRITVNLAPAHIKKEGTGFDLPIALGILGATGTIAQRDLDNMMFLGELSLDGRVKPVFGSLCMAIAARQAGCKGIFVPDANCQEAAVVQELPVYAAQGLPQVVEFLRGNLSLDKRNPITAIEMPGPSSSEDFSEVKGQQHAKRALEITAAGGHNLLMIGPPGSGKTMLARRLPSILPPLTFEEAIETTKIHSVAGCLSAGQGLIHERSFRSPHHTISDAGLIGGGAVPRPGEVSLAHHGVLFLDELPEFKRHVLEVLRQPLEDKQVTIARASSSLTYPASFMLVAAMNPCPCGYYSDPVHHCRCTEQQIRRYRARISGPLLDRIDLQIEVPAVPHQNLVNSPAGMASHIMRERVVAARARQTQRFRRTRIYCNAQMQGRHMEVFCHLDPACAQLLRSAILKFGLSARAANRIIKIARTIADLAGKESIDAAHLAEAIQYRSLERIFSGD
jgi:magnesium chelatase family protein